METEWEMLDVSLDPFMEESWQNVHENPPGRCDKCCRACPPEVLLILDKESPAAPAASFLCLRHAASACIRMQTEDTKLMPWKTACRMLVDAVPSAAGSSARPLVNCSRMRVDAEPRAPSSAARPVAAVKCSRCELMASMKMCIRENGCCSELPLCSDCSAGAFLSAAVGVLQIEALQQVNMDW